MSSETLALLIILASFIACCACLFVGYRIGYDRGHMEGWSEAKQDRYDTN